jgi:hypothetical protein
MFELHYFGEIICLEFQDNPEPLSAPSDSFDDWTQQLPFEITIMQQQMQQHAAQTSQQELPAYVMLHHDAAITIANQYRHILGAEFKDMDQFTEENTRLNLAKIQYRGIETMLAFIQNHFYRYFDMDAHVARPHQEWAQAETAAPLPQLREALLAKEISEELVDIALKPLEDFAVDNIPETYRRLLYFQDLIRELGLIIDGIKKGDPEEELFDTLRYLNFNSVTFRRYIRSRYTQQIEACDTREEKLITIIRLSDDCESFDVRSHTALRPGEPSLVEKIGGWLQQRKNMINEIAEVSSPGAANAKGYKLPISLTGSELGLLIRVLVFLGIITETVKVKIFRFFSENFLVENQFEVSPDTLDSRYNSPSIATRTLMSKLFKKMDRCLNDF